MPPKGNRQPAQLVVYSQSILTRTVKIDMQQVGKNINEILLGILQTQFEGKCSVEGYIKPFSIIIIDISSGLVIANKVVFDIIFQCQVCLPVEGMEIMCSVINVTKAGIRCESTENPSPLIIFVARDHHYSNDAFANVKEKHIIRVKVIGQRFELNDTHISIIGEYMPKVA
jgi:DNA-directed RNA polymerase subunit E'/Rpb7